MLSDNFKCECIDNEGDNNGIENTCFTCDYICGSCLNSQTTGWVTCLESANSTLTNLGQCLCKTSYHDDFTDNIECQKCHQGMQRLKQN